MTWTIRPRSRFQDISYINTGPADGETIVFLHGVGLSADAWGAQFDHFSDRFHVVAPDQPGHGQSSPLANANTLEAYGDNFANFIESFGKPVHLIGHSLGALIAIDLAVRRADIIKSVSALNAVHARSDAALQAVKERAKALLGGIRPDNAPTLRRWFGSDLRSPAAMACADWLNHTDLSGYAAAYQVFAQERGPSDTQLRGMETKALFMTGSEEPNSTPQMSIDMAQLAPAGKAVIIDGAAHMLPMTHPDEVNDQIDQFLNSRN